MEQAAEKLTEASHKLAEAMYQQAGPQGPATGAPGARRAPVRRRAAASGDEVIDAEYVDVDKK